MCSALDKGGSDSIVDGVPGPPQRRSFGDKSAAAEVPGHDKKLDRQAVAIVLQSWLTSIACFNETNFVLIYTTCADHPGMLWAAGRTVARGRRML
jgi:hypothetical protein